MEKPNKATSSTGREASTTPGRGGSAARSSSSAGTSGSASTQPRRSSESEVIDIPDDTTLGNEPPGHPAVVSSRDTDAPVGSPLAQQMTAGEQDILQALSGHITALPDAEICAALMLDPNTEEGQSMADFVRVLLQRATESSTQGGDAEPEEFAEVSCFQR